MNNFMKLPVLCYISTWLKEISYKLAAASSAVRFEITTPSVITGGGRSNLSSGKQSAPGIPFQVGIYSYMARFLPKQFHFQNFLFSERILTHDAVSIRKASRTLAHVTHNAQRTHGMLNGNENVGFQHYFISGF